MSFHNDEDWGFYIETPPSLKNSATYNSPCEILNNSPLNLPTYNAPEKLTNPIIVRPDGEAPTDPTEIESRAVNVLNLPKIYDQSNIQEIVNPQSIINTFDYEEDQLHIEFFDIRHAIAFRQFYNNLKFNGQTIEVKFSVPRPVTGSQHPINNGTIVLFHLPPSITNPTLSQYFSQYGEIRQIRGTPQKPTQRFIEYWDTRGSEAAVHAMNGVLMSGSKISIEFSVPGGMRRKAFK
ncbi:hypothetical protein TRFO_17384 [Tritrichomonas foetus]|uniref:RRM domain-containing protein n=1 Tax=Tritrichomonas foetus TaxID=1144522 RepID=A0A1J4KMZ1_9EUKA|nr:hypothetical protein TRFO_17384 [Tritrichomonas foetus]|eukprot:OHT12681.1 hypothetical protein TRFO_17384 [Tritrichomonas foetus]